MGTSNLWDANYTGVNPFIRYATLICEAVNREVPIARLDLDMDDNELHIHFEGNCVCFRAESSFLTEVRVLTWDRDVPVTTIIARNLDKRTTPDNIIKVILHSLMYELSPAPKKPHHIYRCGRVG